MRSDARVVAPPEWVVLDWCRRNGVVSVLAQRGDGLKTTVMVDTLPMMAEIDPLVWFKQVLDLKLLWAVS